MSFFRTCHRQLLTHASQPQSQTLSFGVFMLRRIAFYARRINEDSINFSKKLMI